jgi:histidine triad (HIT) family protein
MSECDCIFCRIVAGQLPSFPLFEDEHSMAFMDINPVARGHTLVISKRHAETILDIPTSILQAVVATAQRVAQAIDKAFAPPGITIVQSNGPGAAQSVPHFHLHVVPRTFYDDLPMNWHITPGDRRTIEEAALAIRAALGEQV